MSAIAIGNFDGVHLGHRTLLAAAHDWAVAQGTRSLALTFEPHPATVLTPHLAPPRITSPARKLELIAACGIDETIALPFTAEIAAMSAPEFVEHVLVERLGARHVVVGYDFNYGRGRGGTISTLEAHGARAGFTVDVVDKVLVDGEVASSTHIRGYLRGGDLAAARRLLGRDYDIDGTVIRGAQRGAALGFPTANIDTEIELPLAPGIYACWLDERAAVASLGTNPTFVEHGGRLVLEVHVLDWRGDLYGQRVRTRFVKKLRDEAKFDSIEALVAQITRDCEDARMVLG